MINYLVQRFLWFRERGFVQITQKTLVSLFPFFLFSGIIRVISLSVFSELGYINQLFSVSDWLPAFKITGQVLINLSNFLGGLAGPLSTYFAGKYTAGHYGRSTGMQVNVTPQDAKVVINSRTGSVVMNREVTLDSCAVAQGNLSVTVNRPLSVRRYGSPTRNSASPNLAKTALRRWSSVSGTDFMNEYCMHTATCGELRKGDVGRGRQQMTS